MSPMLPPACLSRLQMLLARPGRTLLGIVAPPGAGKSTLAAAVAAATPDRSVVVPMDGFHLANAELQRLRRAERKGAPDTFDAAGYVSLLRRLREQPTDEIVYAPAFRREIEEPIAGAIGVAAHVRLVVTEGNYLLLTSDPWAGVRPMLDEVWYVDVDPAVRMQRLVRRHEAHGRTPEAARAWAASTDEPNARLVAQTRDRADFFVDWNA
jgi:pantothenate kinase